MTPVRLLIFWTALTLYGTSCRQNYPQAESTTNESMPGNTLAGTWKLIEFADLDSLTGNWIYRYGKNPKGYFTYTKTKIVNLNISSAEPLKISEDSTKKYFPNLYEYIDKTALGYFGFYTVNWEKSIITHHVKGGTIPNYIDTEQPRPFILKGDTLIIGDNKTWKRVLVRAD
ncbi:MAG: lipocalin-like domain-containing protein [Cytophagales bacterium]|nr:lipocalin-like domain-containing protein [Cytophagales bacterium]